MRRYAALWPSDTRASLRDSSMMSRGTWISWKRSDVRVWRLGILHREGFHDFGQDAHAVFGHRIVDRGAEPAHGLVALNAVAAGILAETHEVLLQVLVSQVEGDVHPGPVLRHAVADVEGDLVDDVVQELCLPL